MVLSLQTTTFSAYGGIPTYNRLVCRVLNETYCADGSYILIATDSAADLENASPNLPNLQFHAFDGNRFRFSWQCIKLALAHRFELLLIGHVNYAPLGLMLKLLRPGLRYGVMVHGIEVWSRLPALKRRAIQRADFITSVSQYTKDRVVSLNGVEADRIYLLPNTLEREPSGSKADTVLPSGVKLLSVCRLERSEQYKGVDTVIETLPAVVSRIPALQYYVIGNGTDLERHKTLARQKGMADRVHFLGSVTPATLRSYYQACDLFVMPSAGEGFGIVYLEAMQYGKPVVAAKRGAAPEVVLDGITGRLVEYGNKEQLAETLIDLGLNDEKRRRLGSAGYQRLQDNFTFAHFKETLTEILVRELPPQTLAPIHRKIAPSADSL